MKSLLFFLSILMAGTSVFANDGKSAEAVASPLPASHAIWHQLLQRHVTAAGKVDYAGFKRDMPQLDRYLNILATQTPRADWSRNAQMSYWINAYNAFTVKLIVDNYPLKSIRDLGKPWDRSFIQLGDKSYSLNEIEHKVLRPTFQDPRIHFAVNCASQSCPQLLNEAYTADKLDQQLTAQARAFVNNKRHNDLQGSQAAISQLFDWYKEDFTKKGSLIDFLNQYATRPLQAEATLTYKAYDWKLNE